MATFPSFLPARLRRSIILFLVVVATALGLFLIIFPSPGTDSQEQELHNRIADLRARVEHAETLNVAKKYEMQSLFRHFNQITSILIDGTNESEATRSFLKTVISQNRIKLGLTWEADALAENINWNYDLSLPGIHQFLPNTVGSPSSLIPAFKLADNSRGKVSMVFGIPTVKREHQSYLSVTLRSVLDNLSPEESEDCLVVVFVAETDLTFVQNVADEIKNQFPDQVASGLLEVISPPASFYPDLTALRQTLGDESIRVQWRSKQNLDYAFLMMYAQSRGVYYTQLEDDILTKPTYFTKMKEFALEKSLSKDPWFVIDYCQLGFIGKLFHTSSLPKLIQFFLMFYNDKPCDWLLEDVLHTQVCKLDQDAKQCKKAKNSLWIHYKPSLFQHIGTHSSLKGKVQKLKDKQFGKVAMFVPHFNPPAKINTIIKHYKSYSINRAYNGETFYWGLVPQDGDSILFSLLTPVPLTGFKFVSGNAEHPSDLFYGTDVEIAIDHDNEKIPTRYKRTNDNFVIVGHFDKNGVAEGIIDPDWGPVSHLRFSIHTSSENWVILSEIHLKTEKS